MIDEEKHCVVSQWLVEVDSDKFLQLSSASDLNRNLLDPDSGQGMLTVGLPSPQFLATELDETIFWFPRGIPMGQSLHLASSRIGKQPDTKPGIFSALRSLIGRISSNSTFFTTASEVALHDYVCRLAELSRVPIVEFRRMPNRVDSDWFRNILNSTHGYVCYFNSCSSIDELLIGSAREARILSARAKGNVLKATKARIRRNSQPVTHDDARTYLLIDENLTSPSVADELEKQHIIKWWLFSEAETNQTMPPNHSQNDSKIMPLNEFLNQSKISQNKIDLDDYLIHWTRRRTGPWPGQSRDDFLDDLIFGFNASDHRRIAALCRILASGILIGDSQLCRANVPVVCFSDINVDQVIEKRVFRSHLSRWDFEPCGIAVRKDSLQPFGAKPVIYGDDEAWGSLGDNERPYFQLANSCSGKNQIDWTQEKEWRIAGNLDLKSLGVEAAFLFAESYQEAELVASLSRWPVVVLN